MVKGMACIFQLEHSRMGVNIAQTAGSVTAP